MKMLAGIKEVEFRLNMSSGIYFYKLTAEDFTATRKMILVANRLKEQNYFQAGVCITPLFYLLDSMKVIQCEIFCRFQYVLAAALAYI
jgi:hypothetical protein